jgi:threonine/homoserine/homoserine lactone efflux protein
MDITLLIKGIGLGLAIAAPVGPIGVLCIRRTLAYGRLTGFMSGLGAATADAFFGCLAALGFSLAASLAGDAPLPIIVLRILGGLFLLYLGISTFRSNPATEAARTSGRGLWRAYLSTLFLTITNPLTILSFAAIFAGLGVGASGGGAALLVLGVFCGSALWWSLLCGGVGLFRGALERHTRWINRISGLVIVGFALAVLLG